MGMGGLVCRCILTPSLSRWGGRGGVGKNLLLGLNMNKIRKGDQVVVMTGKDKGKRGSVLRVLANDRVLVENINLVKKHTRPNPNKNVTGGIVEKEMSIHISNVALYNSVSGKGERVGFKSLEDGRKVRYFRGSGEVVDV